MKQSIFLSFKRIFLLSLLFLFFPGLSLGKIDPTLFSGIKPRNIGPANMSGRIGDIDAVFANPNIIYVGTATGGVWKSINGGLNWSPIFDDQSASSIGAVRICQQNPNIVWVGTGEGNPRNSAGVGRGIFKSIDAGKSWLHLGLDKTEHISRLVLDPFDPDTTYAAAMGSTWGENPDRGVFKTTDGGITWSKILYVDPKTGAADLAMAPDNPNKLLAAMWEHRRWPWFFNSGGPGSGLFITTDAGKNWKKLTPKDGLPEGNLGRIGIAFARNKPHIVYALVEASESVLLRSDDGGFTWKTVNNKPGVSGRPFYYCDIRVNPRSENIVYSLETRLLVSEDGGKEFTSLTARDQAHSDFHAMWIHPDGELMVVGNDGGIVLSNDRGKSWRFARNIPIGQFYHIGFDLDFPFNVYGGLQDNGSWRGPSSVLTDNAIYNYHWRRVGGGDGFDTEPDPENNTCGYAMSQGGRLFYFNSVTGRQKTIVPTESDVKHRFNWNAGFARDPFDPATIYLGSQFVHRSPDRGQTWEIISPDLTSNDPAKQKQADSGGLTRDVTSAENHTTIMCIAPSPIKKDVIWIGTDDGSVRLTIDGGKTWKLVSNNIKGVPPHSWVPHVEASKFDPAAAFAVFEDHRRANWTPYVFMTEDEGNSWKNLVTKDIDGFVHVIEQDPVNKNLLFLGTEFGLFISLNKGSEWFKWTSGFPTVPVTDIAVHPRDHDLVIGTHGRSIYILDDISFLRELDPSLLDKGLHLFKPNDAFQFRISQVSPYSTVGDTEFSGPNRLYGALITFYFNPGDSTPSSQEKNNPGKENKEKPTASPIPGEVPKPTGNPSPELKIEFLDESGKVIDDLKSAPKKGFNRIAWDLREKGPERPELFPEFMSRRSQGPRRGLFVLPGTYTVRLQYKNIVMSHSFQVKPDPRYKIDPEVLKKNDRLCHEIEGWMTVLSRAQNDIKKTREAIKTVSDWLNQGNLENKKALLEKAKSLDEKLAALSDKIRQDSNRQGIFDWSDSLMGKIFTLNSLFIDALEPVTQAAEVGFSKTKALVNAFLEEYNKLFQTEVEDFKKQVTASGFSLFKPFTPLSLENK